MSLESFFKIKELGSSVRQECIGGFTTFLTMSYVVFVIPAMLVDAGMPLADVTSATILCAFIGSVFMGCWANLPIGVAPSLGIPSYIAYTVCGTMHASWQVALGIIFLSGVLFFILTVSKIRQLIVDSVPVDLKLAIVVAIGAFIAFVGMKSSGIIVASPATFVTLGAFNSPQLLLAMFGFLLMIVLLARGFLAAPIVGILVTAFLGYLLGVTSLPSDVSNLLSMDSFWPSNLAFKLDILGALEKSMLFVTFSLTLLCLFDNIATIVGITCELGLMEPDGTVKGMDKAMFSDSISSILSGLIGVTTSVSYAESAAGVAAGAKTGFASVVTGLCFLVILPFAGIATLVPSYATAPVLILVGTLMMKNVTKINFADFTIAVPAFLTIIVMPLSFSICDGFAIGFIAYALLKLFAGRAKEVSLVMWIVSALFVLGFALRAA